MVQPVKALVATSEDLDSLPRIHTMEGELIPDVCSLTYTGALWHTCTHTHTYAMKEGEKPRETGRTGENTGQAVGLGMDENTGSQRRCR